VSSVTQLPESRPRRVPPLLARLVDDAALFPPRSATVADAIRDHLSARTSENAATMGTFLCPASRLPELITELIRVKPVKPLALSLVIDTGLGGVPKALSIVESRNELLALRMVEMPAPSDVDEVWLERVSEFVPEDVIRVIEPRRGGPEWLAGIRRVVTHGSWLKLRCGGSTAESFPSVDELADFITIVSRSGASFKTTAGLSTAVRHAESETGFIQHGFLNLLVATARSLAGNDVHAALNSTDAEALSAEAAALDDQTAHSVRGVFASYGADSLTEPVAELEKLGLL